MGAARFWVEPPAITKASSPRGYPMSLVKLKCDSSRFGDVAVCVLGAKLACESPANSSHKSLWFK